MSCEFAFYIHTDRKRENWQVIELLVAKYKRITMNGNAIQRCMELFNVVIKQL